MMRCCKAMRIVQELPREKTAEEKISASLDQIIPCSERSTGNMLAR